MAKESMAEQQVAEALVSGLVSRCNQCAQQNVDLAEFQRKHPDATLQGRGQRTQHTAGMDGPLTVVSGPFKVVCEVCNSTGLVLSEQGKRFMNILGTHFPQLGKQADPRADRAARAS